MPLSDAWVDFIAGWVSGAVTVLALQPIDTVLTRKQANISANGGLWRGTLPMVSSVPLQNAILMGGYGMGQKFFDPKVNLGVEQPYIYYAAIFTGGLVGGVLQSFLMSPVELLKITRQCATDTTAASNRMPGLSTAVMIATGSAPSAPDFLSPTLWRGLNATLLRDGIPHGVWFVTYEWSKCYGEKVYDAKSPFIPLASGAFAATVSWLIGYPADLIKTRLQANPSGSDTILETARKLVSEANGRVFQGLYRGLGLKLCRAVPGSMIGFSVYEAVKEHLV